LRQARGLEHVQTARERSARGAWGIGPRMSSAKERFASDLAECSTRLSAHVARDVKRGLRMGLSGAVGLCGVSRDGGVEGFHEGVESAGTPPRVVARPETDGWAVGSFSPKHRSDGSASARGCDHYSEVELAVGA
jgi:hypothetical protein